MGTNRVTGERLSKRLMVVADSSLIVDAIVIGLRKSTEFSLLGQVHARTCEVQTVVETRPDVVLVDDMDRSTEVVDLIGEMKRLRPSIAAIVLTMSMDPEWLDVLFEAGASGAISKATHPAVLATLVRETLDGNFVHIQRGASTLGQSAFGVLPAAVEASLTARELEVLQLAAGGSTNAEIARKLWVTEQTVKFHLSNVYRKLEVSNRTEASRFAHLNGLVGFATAEGAAARAESTEAPLTR